jgi:uncharacterized membrane protein
MRNIATFLLLYHKRKANRYWEVDALRGIAITMMVIYHLVFDLNFFGYQRIQVYSGPWMIFARTTATLFIGLAGVSLAISYGRLRHRSNAASLFGGYIVRGLKLVGWGMVITLSMWIFTGDLTVIFGILHLIGAATILAYPFLSLGWLNLPLGAAMIALGLVIKRVRVSYPWLLWLGLKPPELYQLDYFPLLPWFGVALLGVFVGQLFYPNGRQRFNLSQPAHSSPMSLLSWLGRHSLIIYLVHQPLLFAALNAARFIQIGRFG